MFGWPDFPRGTLGVMAGNPRRTALCEDLRTSGPQFSMSSLFGRKVKESNENY